MAGADSAEERKAYSRILTPPPKRIVEDGEFVYGCFSGPPEFANMLDIKRPYNYPLPRFIKDFRCKEWKAFQFGDKRWFFFAVFYEAKTFGLAQFNAFDKETNKSFEIKHFLPLSGFGIKNHLDGERLVFRKNHSKISMFFDLNDGLISLEARQAPRKGYKGFRGQFQFAYNSRQVGPSSVCLPLGINRAMYSTKALMPMQGWFKAGDERYELSSPSAMGIFDDHKGYYPYNLHYDWVTGFGLDSKGRRAGFNLTDNQVRDQKQYNENVLWINSRVFPLPPIKVTRPNGVDEAWHIQDTEGLVDLLFKPKKKNRIKMNLLAFSVDYNGPFGSFEGTLRSPDGSEKIDVKDMFGMGEDKYLMT
ncbi:DUF2804 domain-containing protein [Spirochaetota bacterium]